MGRRMILGVLLLLVATLGMPVATAGICNGPGACEGDGRPTRDGSGLPGSSTPATFSIDKSSVIEGPPPAGQDGNLLVFTVTLTGGTGAASVRFATEDGTAEECCQPGDYQGDVGKLSFAGPGKKKVRILVFDDNFPESNETMFVKLSKPVGATIEHGTGRGTILNNDNP